MEIGIRELKNNLSRYVSKVREGEEVYVTDHGKAVALLIPIRGLRVLDRLVDEGTVTRAATTTKPSTPKRLKTKGTVSDLVFEQRQ